MLKLYTGFYTF